MNQDTENQNNQTKKMKYDNKDEIENDLFQENLLIINLSMLMKVFLLPNYVIKLRFNFR